MTIEVSGTAVAAPRALVAREFLSMSGEFQAEMAVSPADFQAAEALFSVEPKAVKHTVYNFEVEGTHTYIAGGYRVHNTSTLSFYDPDTNGVLTAIYEDAQGRLVWESVTPDGGKWKAVSTTDPLSPNTTTVEKTYELGELDAQGNRVTRFYLKQESQYATINGEQVLVDIEVVENYWLLGDEIGGGVSAVVTPFILQAIGAETPFERLAAGTLIETILQNIAEGGLNFLHHSILYADSNGQTTNEMIFGAWRDFGIDLGVNFAEGVVSITSELIMAEIFSSVDINSLPEEFMAELVSKGIDNVLGIGMDNFIDNIFGADSALGQAYKPDYFDFSQPSSYLGLAFSLVLDEVFPAAETTEGAVAGALGEFFAKSFLTQGMALLPGMLVAQLIGFFVGKIFDALFDKDPQAFANLEFNATTKTWSIASIDSDDGGSVELATQLGKSVSEKLNEIAKLMRSTDLAFNDDIRIGHYEDNLRNGDGINYGMTNSKAVFAAIVAAIKGMTATDGDLKALRILDLANLEQALAGLAADEAFSLIYSKLRIASDYQYYLENTEYINQLLLTAPDSALAKSWLATILSAESSGLNAAYAVVGDAGNNLYVTADGKDTISGGAGNDTIRSYGEDDLIQGGDGNDLISAGIGADTVDGGEGIDTITFDESGRAVSLDLSQGIGLTQDAQGDVYINIENVTGSRFSDLITGSAGANEIDGLAGNDVVYGHGGNDIVRGNTGDDQLFGDQGANSSVIGNDILYGDEGDDTLSGDGGIDTFFGGEGFDSVSYKTATAAVIASLETNVVQTWEYYNGTYGYTETMTGVEGLIGSNFNDSLTGDTGDNRLEGGLRNDTIKGGRGADVYVYALGDGSDYIVDASNWTEQVVDRLEFTNLLSACGLFCR
ncbi:MAG: calcium-binding protein [Rhodospirillales bacterium]|nr:calcium-binding protein [Rhodospirillales bacterium]